MEYSIGKAAELVGLTTYTLRYYEKEGLLPEIKRNTKGVRVYDDNDLFWIDLIRCLRDTGMQLSEIKEIVDLSLKGDETIADRKEILISHKHKINEQMIQLQEYMNKIERKIAWYECKDKGCK